MNTGYSYDLIVTIKLAVVQKAISISTYSIQCTVLEPPLTKYQYDHASIVAEESSAGGDQSHGADNSIRQNVSPQMFSTECQTVPSDDDGSDDQTQDSLIGLFLLPKLDNRVSFR